MHMMGSGHHLAPPPAPRLVRRQMSEVALREEQHQVRVCAYVLRGGMVGGCMMV